MHAVEVDAAGNGTIAVIGAFPNKVIIAGLAFFVWRDKRDNAASLHVVNYQTHAAIYGQVVVDPRDGVKRIWIVLVQCKYPGNCFKRCSFYRAMLANHAVVIVIFENVLVGDAVLNPDINEFVITGAHATATGSAGDEAGSVYEGPGGVVVEFVGEG